MTSSRDPAESAARSSTRPSASVRSAVERIAHAVRHFGRLELRNLGMATRTLAVLSRPSLANWAYNPEFLLELPKGAYRALLDPNAMNDFQKVRAEDGYVSTPADGLLAGVTERGRLSSLFAPHTGFTDQIPYHVDDDDAPLRGAKPRDGAFFGIRLDGDVEWLFESTYDHDLSPVPGTGALRLEMTRRGDSRGSRRRRVRRALSDRAPDREREAPGWRRLRRLLDSADRSIGRGRGGDTRRDRLRSRAAGDPRANAPDLEIVEHVYVIPETDILARDLRIRNAGDSPVESVYYYMQANANAELQYPPGITSRNRVTVTDGDDLSAPTAEIRWEDVESDRVVRAFPAPGTPVRDAGVADAPLDRLFAEPARERDGDYVGGFLELDVGVDPGETATVTVYTTGRSDVDTAGSVLSSDAAARRTAMRGWWADVVDDVDTSGVPRRHVPRFVASAVALANLYDPESGSISAAPHVQPAYYPSWPRDGSITAVALARAGLVDPATDFLGRFLPRVQEADGSFTQCYASTGEPAGVIPVENDQQPVFVWAVREVYEAVRETDPEAAATFLRRTWPAVDAALAYTVDAIADNDLLSATHDYAEMWTDADQSLWTNAFAYRGLLDGAMLADRLGHSNRASTFRTAAERVGDAIEREFFDVDAPAGHLSSGAQADPDWSPVGEVASHLTLTGPEQRPTTMNAVALWPARWADDYGYREDLLPSLAAAYDASTTRWLPKEFGYAAALYRAGDVDGGDRILAALSDAVTAGGTFAEELEADGTQNFAALGWSNAAFLLACDERRRTAT